jgi:hypothetical protein
VTAVTVRVIAFGDVKLCGRVRFYPEGGGKICLRKFHNDIRDHGVLHPTRIVVLRD